MVQILLSANLKERERHIKKRIVYRFLPVLVKGELMKTGENRHICNLAVSQLPP